MLSPNQACFMCAACRRVVSIDRRVPPEVIRETFAMLDLQRTVSGSLVEHPMVCSDACYGHLNRHGLQGYEVAPIGQRDEDAHVTGGAW